MQPRTPQQIIATLAEWLHTDALCCRETDGPVADLQALVSCFWLPKLAIVNLVLIMFPTAQGFRRVLACFCLPVSVLIANVGCIISIVEIAAGPLALDLAWPLTSAG